MIRPSGSHEWYYCHGSQVMQEGIISPADDATEEGTAAHWVGESVLKSYITKNAEILGHSDFINKLSPNNILITDEIYYGAMTYVNEILNYCNETGLLQSLHVEEKLDISIIYPEMSGTPDCWVYNPNNVELIIWDLKFGYGHVEAYENPQLMIYIAGILQLLNIEGISDQLLTVKMIIVQPRSYHSDGNVREWVVKASELRGYFNKLTYAANQAMNGEGLCSPGIHCRHCTGRFKCTSFSKSVYNYLDVITSATPMELTGQNLVNEWKLLNRMLKLIEYRKSAIDSQVEASLQNGEFLPGARLNKSYGRERWKKDVPVNQLLNMAKMYGADISKPENLDTPNQSLVKIKAAAKKFNVKVDKSLIEQWIEKPFTGYKVVEDDGTEATKMFKGQ